MPSPNSFPAFGITHPLGLPRPIDVDNFFSAKRSYFADNLMPIPNGCLAHFDTEIYRPYAKGLVEFLKSHEFGWSGPVCTDEPARYCLLWNGVPTSVPSDLALEMPAPPWITLDEILTYFDENFAWAPALQLLDILTLVREGLGEELFADYTSNHSWVAEFMQ